MTLFQVQVQVQVQNWDVDTEAQVNVPILNLNLILGLELKRSVCLFLKTKQPLISMESRILSTMSLILQHIVV